MDTGIDYHAGSVKLFLLGPDGEFFKTAEPLAYNTFNISVGISQDRAWRGAAVGGLLGFFAVQMFPKTARYVPWLVAAALPAAGAYLAVRSLRLSHAS